MIEKCLLQLIPRLKTAVFFEHHVVLLRKYVICSIETLHQINRHRKFDFFMCYK